jgi:hypothetical protein
MSWYYRTEAKGIQGWIMSTSRLRELRGGSAAIERFMDETRMHLEDRKTGATLIQAAAGALSCTFETEEALKAFASTWLWRVDRALPGLQFIQAWAETSGPGRVSESARKAVQARLAQKRNHPLAPVPVPGPLVARNARTGLPAVGRGRSTPEGGLLVDAVTRCKEAMQKVNRDLWSELDGRKLHLPETTEGLIAVIHADGTGVGQRLVSVPEGQLQAFSEALREASNQALTDALREVAATIPPERPIPVQVIVAGGDDLTVLCAANLALDLTRGWLRHFEARTADLPGTPKSASFKGLHAGAGIAISSVRFPFMKAYELAEHLCALAKRAARGPDLRPVDSAIAMRRITASFDDPTFNQGVWRLAAHTGPDASPLPSVAALDALRRASRTLARGGLRQWLGAFEAAIEQGGSDRVTPNRLWERLREVADPGAIAALEAALSEAHGVVKAPGDALYGAFSGAFSEADPTASAWTPIKDALLLNTIDRRAGKA